MAHGDYNCCLICDSKMSYVGLDARTKEDVCSACIKKMRELGDVFATQQEVIDFLKQKDDKEAIKWLRDVDYRVCCYKNDLDDYLKRRGFVDLNKRELITFLPTPKKD